MGKKKKIGVIIVVWLVACDEKSIDSQGKGNNGIEYQGS